MKHKAVLISYPTQSEKLDLLKKIIMTYFDKNIIDNRSEQDLLENKFCHIYRKLKLMK